MTEKYRVPAMALQHLSLSLEVVFGPLTRFASLRTMETSRYVRMKVAVCHKPMNELPKSRKLSSWSRSATPAESVSPQSLQTFLEPQAGAARCRPPASPLLNKGRVTPGSLSVGTTFQRSMNCCEVLV